MNTDIRIVEPGQLVPPVGEIRFLFLPARVLFSRRAERLRFLSKGHPLGDYLNFLALLADAQQDALNRFPTLTLPGSDEQARCCEQGTPLLDFRARQRNPAWRAGLTSILQHLNEAALPAEVKETATGLMQAPEDVLEQTAERILTGEFGALSPRELPFVAAALQVYWVHMASSLKEDVFGRTVQRSLCPVCGSHPSVGVVQSSGKEQGLRYLSCSLCASQWHMVRLTCSACESTEGLDYHTLEGSNAAVKAESCNICNSYLKLLYLGKDLPMEATADDLSTLALDMLMDNEGIVRRGPNLFFHPGSPH
jgi:FdhE protein